ncbi:MAG: 1-deoxy-D-xylulose-5-phosphate synthase [Coriobacteriales bacterium]
MSTYLSDLHLCDADPDENAASSPEGDGPFILSSIQSPADLVPLSYDQLDQLAAEIRAMILATVSKNGGHLASSLGAVEIIIAMHRVFPSPDDKLLFDVGHQTLAHKLLTGRFDRFSSLRQHGGISGFPRREESPYDVYDSGHAADSLSTALGILLAKDLGGEPGEVAALIGDGSISSGMAFEALNQIGQLGKNLIIVLNDNEMSISPNVGALSLHLGKMRLSKRYIKTRDKVERKVNSFGDVGRIAMSLGEMAKDSVKKALVAGTLFEDMGITYIGPIDGHDLEGLEDALRAAKAHGGPVIIHAVTKKGKGYALAEADPSRFHGTPPFDLETGEQFKKPGASGFTKVFSKLMCIEARRNRDLIGITAAMADGTGLAAFAGEFPRRFFDVGMAEEHAVTLASGMALGGKKPVVAIYSTFLQRGFDQMITNVALQNLNVTFMVDRAGIVGADGSTHHGLFDLAYLRMMPNLIIMAPSNTEELAGAFATAMAYDKGPVAIRYPRASREVYEPTGDEDPWEVGKAVKRREGSDIAILAIGRMVDVALEAAELLSGEGIECSVHDMRWVKPLDEDVVRQARHARLIVTIEDGTTEGGFATGVLEELGKHDNPDTHKVGHPALIRLGVSDHFVDHGSDDELFADLGLTPEMIARRVADELGISDSLSK